MKTVELDNDFHVMEKDEYFVKYGEKFEKVAVDLMMSIVKDFGGFRGSAIDVGAHMGIWTRRLSKEFVNVLAFEPVPDHYECLTKNTKGLKNVELFDVGLSEKAGRTEFLTLESGLANSGMACVPGSNRWAKTPEDGRGMITVRMDRLDKFSAGNVKFIKIDTEGHEDFVIKGGLETISHYLPIMYIEIFSWKKFESKKALFELGYEAYEHLEHNFIFMPKTATGFDPRNYNSVKDKKKK